MARHTAFFVAVIAALLGLSLWSALAGQLGVGASDVFAAMGRSMGLVEPDPAAAHVDATLWYVRFPRILLAALVGAGLAVAGVALQAIFGNPLAEPSIIGVSSGAAVGAAGAVVFSGTIGGHWFTAAGAFAGGIAATAVVAIVARTTAGGSMGPAMLILVGVAVNAVCGGLVSLLTFIADPSARDQIVFWQMGSFAGADWTAVGLVAAVTLGVGVLLWSMSRTLDLLSLGERPARHLGVDVVRLRRIIITAAALLVAVGVAFSGIVAFVGLVVPHAIRLILGPGHRALIPASLVGGALTTTAADLAARTLISGADLPLGMLTSLVGGPLFFWMLLRGRKGAMA
ncbi:FecCD family ABC transporter permease [Corynebacterium sp. 335C]